MDEAAAPPQHTFMKKRQDPSPQAPDEEIHKEEEEASPLEVVGVREGLRIRSRIKAGYPADETQDIA